MERMHGFAITTAIVILALYVYGQQNLGMLFVVSNIISPLVALAPASLSVLLLMKYGFKPNRKFGRVWPLISIGLCLWFLGELTWTIYALVFGIRYPYPSLADAFWLAGYPFLILSVYSYVSLFKSRLNAKLTAGASIAAAIVAAVVILVLIEPVFNLSADPVAQFFDMAYPALDAVMLAVTIAGLLLFLPGRLAQFWALIAVGFIFEVLGDVSFSYATATGVYYDGHPLELFFHFGYLVILLGLYQHKLAL